MKKEQFIEILKQLDFPIGHYYILSSGCLMLYGMRDEIGDIDLCISEELFDLIKDKYDLTDDKKNQCNFYKVNENLEVVVNKKEDMIYDMKDGFPVEKLTTILNFKLERNAEKDQKDIYNIMRYFDEKKSHKKS